MIPYCVYTKKSKRHGYIASGLDRCVHFTVKSRSAFRVTVPLRVRIFFFFFSLSFAMYSVHDFSITVPCMLRSSSIPWAGGLENTQRTGSSDQGL